ncbi:MAG TPA: ABC transporter permease, partial [Gemmatimonadaceae bacterium]|nr:ABC transporter permease [Gemmatimonadaceae bacterium]
MHDLKLALRVLRKSPFVTTVAVLSLALGIGTNTAIFSFTDQLLMRPLPVTEPGRLVNLSAPRPKPGSQQCQLPGDCDDVFSYPMWLDLEHAAGPFSGIAAHFPMGANVAVKDRTSHEEALLVSGTYFPVLGVRPAAGRLLTPDDDKVVGANFVAVLGYDYWQAKLGGDPSVVGSPITINGKAYTVAGVAPAGFAGTTIGRRPAVYVPISMRAQMDPDFTAFENRRFYWAYLFARLKPGVTMAQAKTAINAIYHPIINDVEVPLQKEMSEQTMAKFKAKEIVLADGRTGQSSVHREARTPMLMLLAITGIVLLIACANIANLLLARAAGRSVEMSVRLSLGARRAQLIRQLLTESLVLALLGGLASLVVARWTLAGILAIMPPEGADMLAPVVDGRMMLFAAGLSVATGFAFGLFPALHSTRADLITSIRAGAGQLSGARAATRFRATLATAQVALSMALLIFAGLFIKSLGNVARTDLGLRPDGLVTFAVEPQRNGYSHERTRVFLERVEGELASIPGVTGVTASLVPILAGDNWGNDVSVEGVQYTPDKDMNTRFSEVGPGHFKVIGATMLSGREFTTADAAGSPKVAIVNEAFARKFGLGAAAVGKHMAFGNKTQLDVEIVGLVRDNKYSDVKDSVPPVAVTPWRQDTTLGDMNFYVRTAGPTDGVVRAIPDVVKRLDPSLPVQDLKTMPQQVKENIFLDRMISTAASAFATLATLLAAIGLYGVLAYSVAQRTREIGVRMALGADGWDVRRLVLRQVALMVLVGGVIGIAGAYGLGRAARSLLYGLAPSDPWVMAGAVLLLGSVAFGAGYIPALRASRVSPM